MEQKVIYKGEELPTNFLNSSINAMIETIKGNGIKSGNIVICRADTPLGVYLQWATCCKLNLLPAFVPSDYSLESIDGFKTSIRFKAILDLKGINLHLYANDVELENPLKDVEKYSVIHLTSATTGMPKFVLRTRKQLDEELRRYIAYLKIDKADVILPTVPLNHSFGFISGMLLSIATGAKLVLPDMLLPRNIIKLSNDNKVTFMLGAPYFYKKMLAVSSEYKLNDELRYIIASGGPMEENLQNEFRKRFNKKLIQQYGSTETGSLCVDFDGKDYNCVGKPIPGVNVKFINDKFLRSCICIDSPNTIGSYIYSDSIKHLGNGLYMMGDVGDLRNDGKIAILGRTDSILIINGKKVNKHFVASIIEQIEGVLKANVFLKKHNDVEELMCEYVGTADFNKAIFIDHCKKVLSDYQIPKNFIRVGNISRGRVTWKTES